MFRTVDERTSRYEPSEDTTDDTTDNTTSENGKTVIGTNSELDELIADYFSGR